MRKGKKAVVAVMALLTAGLLATAVACGGGTSASESGKTSDTASSGSVNSGSGGTDSSSQSQSDSNQGGSSEEPEPPVIDAEKLDGIPVSSVVTQATAGSDTAEASWFADYGEDSLDFTAYVKDGSLYKAGTLYTNDGVEIILSKVQRLKGYSAGTLSVIVDATGAVGVKNLSTGAQVSDSGVTAEVKEFTLSGTAVDGYYLNVSVPYTAIEATAAEKNAAVCLGLTNAVDAMTIKSAYDATYKTDSENVHTYAAITGKDAFAENPYFQYNMVWGDGGSLKASSVWNTDGDDGSVNASITMTGVDNADNYIYMYRSGVPTFYAETKLTVKELLGGEKWGKFGVVVTSADGQDGFFFYVDAASADGTSFNADSVKLGFNTRSNGGWDNGWKEIGTLGGDSSQYQNGGYVTLGVYRQGGAFGLYAGGNLIGRVSCGIGAEETAYAGLASFNIVTEAKDYSLETDVSQLGDYEIVTEEKDYLFIGDSYIDRAFWYTYSSAFGALSAANEGVGGTQTAYWLNNLEVIRQMYAPKNIVVHIGVNDVDDGNTTGTTVNGRLDELMAAYRAAFPETNIYYVGLVHNMMFTGKWAEYDKVNAHMKEVAAADDKISFIDMAQYITADANGSTMHWFNADGLHYGVDGYAVFNREICKALGIAREASRGGLGDVTAEGAPSFAYSAGWTFDAEGTARNTGAAESQIFLSDLYATDFYAEAKISVAGLTAEDPYPKAGLAVRTEGGTWFWALDANGADNPEKYVNGWSQVFYRPEVVGRDWDWNGCFSAYQWTYNNQFPYEYPDGVSYDYKTDGSFKTMAVAKVGSKLYLIADGKVVNCLTDAIGADTKAAVSVFNFNLEMYAKEGVVITEANALKAKLAGLKIYENADKQIDGSMDDWTDAQKSNPYEIPATDGRIVKIYATMDTDGVYVFYDAIHNAFVDNLGNWWENTNIELKFDDNLQRFASANGLVSRWEFGTRAISRATFKTATENGKQHTTAELFIPYACIDGLDRDSAYAKMGFAWKTGGEEGFAWSGGDFWYGAEADPGTRNVIVTANGIATGTLRAVDGDLSDWSDDVFTSSAGAQTGVTAEYSAFLGDDGLYIALRIKEASIDISRTNTDGNWWMNTNFEFFVTANHDAARVMTFGGKLYHTGRITDAAMTFTDGETEDVLCVEIFISDLSMKEITAETASVVVDMGGQLYGAVANSWQDYMRNLTVAKKA